MNFLIISHAEHKKKGNTISAYAPYVREMNLWLKYVDSVTIVAPKVDGDLTPIEMNYKHNNIHFKAIPSIQFTSIITVFISLFKLPKIFFTLFKACNEANHIHLRCPGNIGLLGCFVQICFPKKIKTAKYAGNWDPKAKQQRSYKLQKWMLANTFLTKNMHVLVYGLWKNQSKNIKPFFTATFKNDEIEDPKVKDYRDGLSFVFLGSLVEGKRPLLAIKIIKELQELGYKVRLDIFGDGILRAELEEYITKNKLDKIITLRGNQNIETIKTSLKSAHFLILPSKSEGWPKAVAEAMFFGVIPIVTKISCVPYMLDNGNRGILIEPELNNAVAIIESEIKNVKGLEKKSNAALNWSQKYTLDTFENEIKKILTTSK